MTRGLAGLVMLLPALGWAGPWTEPAGRLRLSLVGIHWQADERFVGVPNVGGRPGERVELGTDIPDAELVHQQGALDLALGLGKGIEFTAWLPVVRARFTDAASETITQGVGDPILGVNWRVLPAIAYGIQLKLPVSSVPRTLQLPISEGQTDLTLWQRSGAGFRSGWWQFDMGYRLRFEREDQLSGARAGVIRRRPGDEFVALLGGGWRPWHPLPLAGTLALEVLAGADGEERDGQDNALQLPRRQILEVQPGLLYTWRGWTGQAVFAWPLAGQNHPAGPRIILSVGTRLQLWE
jgi:hypothetical protein